MGVDLQPKLTDLFWMKQAYDLACQAQKCGEVPVGAIVVSEQQQCLGTGYNQVLQRTDATAHAELLAIQAASATLGNYRLLNATLYVTLEPCCMCAGALVQARIKRVVFATRDFKAGAAGSVNNLLSGYPFNHQVMIDEGTLQAECSLLLSDFFKRRRS